jgi:CO/xanthine dehydrogenase FAD-binding subunit
MLVEVQLPPLEPRTGCAFVEFSRRPGDYAQCGVAAVVSLGDGDACRAAKLVYLSSGDTPMAADHAAGMLAGQPLTAESIRAAAEHAAAQEIEPTTDIHATAEYKRHLARVLTERAVALAADRARAGA